MYKLANGHKVSIIPIEGSPAVVKNYVNVGSMNETANIKAIFLNIWPLTEQMARTDI